jgi:DNA-binding NtrC family response regulator
MKRLLLVDDEVGLVDLLKEHFEKDYEIVTAMSGAAAVERFARMRPDAVFLDISMPGVTGVQVLQLLRETDSSVPVIMMTANKDSKLAEDCLKSGAFAYVPKPFNLVYMDHIAALAVEQRRRPR